jgi:hypothetical protein
MPRLLQGRAGTVEEQASEKANAGPAKGETRGSGVIPFPMNEIHDEDTALDWWEDKFASSCETLGVQINAAALVRSLVASLREIRGASLDAHITLTEAAVETGYSTKQVSRWVKDGKLENVGTTHLPRVRRRDVLQHKKTSILPQRPAATIVASAQDIARSVVNSKKR